MIEQKDFDARLLGEKDEALAEQMRVEATTVGRWKKTDGGIPRHRLIALLDALNLSVYDPATHVVMTHARAKALETLAAEALKAGTP